jgi:hypothetical protein
MRSKNGGVGASTPLSSMCASTSIDKCLWNNANCQEAMKRKLLWHYCGTGKTKVICPAHSPCNSPIWLYGHQMELGTWLGTIGRLIKLLDLYMLLCPPLGTFWTNWLYT